MNDADYANDNPLNFSSTSELYGVLTLLISCVRGYLDKAAGFEDKILPTVMLGPVPTTTAEMGKKLKLDPFKKTKLMGAGGLPIGTRAGGVGAAAPFGAGFDIEFLHHHESILHRRMEICNHLVEVLQAELKKEMNRQVELVSMEADIQALVYYRMMKDMDVGDFAERGVLPGETGLSRMRGPLKAAFRREKPGEVLDPVKRQFQITRERAEAADSIMRLLETYRLVSAMDSIDYLKHTLDETMPQLAKLSAAKKAVPAAIEGLHSRKTGVLEEEASEVRGKVGSRSPSIASMGGAGGAAAGGAGIGPRGSSATGRLSAGGSAMLGSPALKGGASASLASAGGGSKLGSAAGSMTLSKRG